MDGNLQLLERFQGGEPAAETELVEKNMGLIRSVAYRYSGMAGGGVDFEDLCQIGAIGLVKAIRNFDLSRGLMFSTYAVPLIIGEIRKFLRDDGSVKVSRSIRENYYKIKKESRRLSNELMRDPTISELCAATSLSQEDVIFALEAGNAPASLDETREDDNPLSDRISEDEQISGVDRIALRDAVAKLDKRDRQIVALRYFSAKTQVETAKILGMTQVQVSRREKRIIDSLRKEFE